MMSPRDGRQWQAQAMRKEALLIGITAELDGREWTPETIARIAERLRAAGYTIREPAEV